LGEVGIFSPVIFQATMEFLLKVKSIFMHVELNLKSWRLKS
jgi:hypothetical protein